MKLPNVDRAFVDIAKLRDYCLNPLHNHGKHKARVFAAALDLHAADAPLLRHILLKLVLTEDAAPRRADQYGQRYVIDFDFTHGGKTARVRSSWVVHHDEDFPRLTSCYVL